MTIEKDRKCSECQAGTLVSSVYSDTFNHGKSTIKVDGLECYACDACGADPIFTEQIRRNQLRIADAKRAVDGHLLGAEVRQVRKALGLSQQDASCLFGGGANAFSKYERGDTLQSDAMDCLLRIMGRHPFLLKDFEQQQLSIGPAAKPLHDVIWYDADELESTGENYIHVRESVTVFAGDYSDQRDWQKAA